VSHSTCRIILHFFFFLYYCKNSSLTFHFRFVSFNFICCFRTLTDKFFCVFFDNNVNRQFLFFSRSFAFLIDKFFIVMNFYIFFSIYIQHSKSKVNNRKKVIFSMSTERKRIQASFSLCKQRQGMLKLK
jgi:hypothetical protein